MEDETGSGTFHWSHEPIIVNPDPIHQQLLIDLRQARDENKQLREDLSQANNRIGKMGFDFTKGYIFGTFALALTYIAIVAIFK